jgi:D-cysteine desulfhydrase
VPVCDDGEYFATVIADIVREARELSPSLPDAYPLCFLDGFQGPAYAHASQEQLEFMQAVARTTGLVLDPVYSGKALYALYEQNEKPETALFIHTGGLPGLLAQADDFAALLSARAGARERSSTGVETP